MTHVYISGVTDSVVMSRNTTRDGPGGGSELNHWLLRAMRLGSPGSGGYAAESASAHRQRRASLAELSLMQQANKGRRMSESFARLQQHSSNLPPSSRRGTKTKSASPDDFFLTHFFVSLFQAQRTSPT